MGESAACAGANAVSHALLAAIGSRLALMHASLNAGNPIAVGCRIASHALTAGVTASLYGVLPQRSRVRSACEALGQGRSADVTTPDPLSPE